jgi:hypothetical protein
VQIEESKQSSDLEDDVRTGITASPESHYGLLRGYNSLVLININEALR